MIPFFLSPLGRKVGLAIGIVVLLVSIRAYYFHKDSEAGKESQKGVQADDNESKRKLTEKQAQDSIDNQNKIIAAAEKRAEAAEQNQRTLQLTLQAILGRQQQAAQHTASIPDAELHQANVNQIGLRPAGLTQACYTSSEERAINSAVTQWPLCKDESKTQNGVMQEVKDELKALSDKVTAQEKKYSDLAASKAALFEDYRQLYNAHPPTYRSVKCLGLWKCGKRHIGLPDPATLQR